MMAETLTPGEIEKRSFEIITDELEDKGPVLINGKIFEEGTEDAAVIMSVVKRCIHTTADFDYAGSLYFSEGAVKTFYDLIRSGATIVTDTNMALSGISKKSLSAYGCRACCFMADTDVAKEAAERQVTRAHVSMERAMGLDGPVIFVVGNAPTALMTLKEHYDRGDYVPQFVVGVPVGFVNVEAAKDLIIESSIPHIVNRGRKGGSNVAAAIVNALLYAIEGRVL